MADPATKANESIGEIKIDDRSTSDVVVRLRTDDGRDNWIYCHSHILINKSKYFSDRLSDTWPTCQILDSRNCVQVNCGESDFDFHVTFLRLLYGPTPDTWQNVRNALGILQAAVKLGSPHIVSACVDYLEAVPWEESEEEEILKIVPKMGTQAEPILARIQPVNPVAIVKIFISAVRFATSSPPSTMADLKNSAQDQIEYMLSEDDDDVPLIKPDENIKSEVRECFVKLFMRFKDSISGGEKSQLFFHYLSDLSWAFQILARLEIMREFVYIWVEISDNIVKIVDYVSQKDENTLTNSKIIEAILKVLEAIGYGNVILPTEKRLQMVKVWLPFVRIVKPLIDSAGANSDDDGPAVRIDCEMWQSLESAFVSVVLALPSESQAEILNEWLRDKHIRYPDLTEAFEVWCYRSKVAKRRLAG